MGAWLLCHTILCGHAGPPDAVQTTGCGGRIGEGDLNPNLVGGASASGPVPGSLPPSWQWARVSGRRSLRAPSSCCGRSRTCPARPRTRARPPMRARVGRRHASRQHLGGGGHRPGLGTRQSRPRTTRRRGEIASVLRPENVSFVSLATFSFFPVVTLLGQVCSSSL